MTMTRRRLLDDTFKKSVVGNPAIATDSLARMYPGITMQGWTTQDGTPTPETPVPIVSAGTQNQETGKWKYEVEVGCGNLSENTLSADDVDNGITVVLKKDNIYHISGTASGLASVTVAKCELPSGTYTLSGGDGTGPSNYRFMVRALRTGNGGIKGDAYGGAFTQSIEGGMSRLLIQVPDGTTVDDDVYIMLNPGSTPLPYTPYRPPQTVTLTADRPLTKWDRLEKRGGQWGWVYKSAEAVFDGSEKWSLYPNEYVGTLFYTNLPNALSGFQTSLCDKYRNVNRIWDASYDGALGMYGDHNIQSNKYFRPPSAAVETVEQWKAWLSENLLTLWYETKVETFVSLTTAEQETMNALYTYRPTTVLSNQQDCDMTLTYKSRKGMS